MVNASSATVHQTNTWSLHPIYTHCSSKQVSLYARKCWLSQTNGSLLHPGGITNWFFFWCCSHCFCSPNQQLVTSLYLQYCSSKQASLLPCKCPFTSTNREKLCQGVCVCVVKIMVVLPPRVFSCREISDLVNCLKLGCEGCDWLDL